MERTGHGKKKISKKKVLLVLVAIFFLSAAGVAFAVYNSVRTAFDGEVLQSEKRTEDLQLEGSGFTVLLMGVDERENDEGRSDTMILMSIADDSVKMLSIPRDTRVTIAEKGTEDKINHAYAFGGIDMAAKTVEDFLDMPVDYYVKMNMEGLEELVDAVGGVTVVNPFAFSYKGDVFPEGTLTLNGKEALNYSRMRYEDPQGDFGRQMRQRQVIQFIIEKGDAQWNILKYNDILDAVASNVETNLSISDMISIQKQYGNAKNNFQSEKIDGYGEIINGVYYYIVSENERKRLSSVFKEHINIP
ncbi:LCP family glycopolymer transferase [Domibacillus epiphyticus]|uniref:LytR family transcriptional regulator n=1 Tax=Domibacillus epiphyticus TaxID=1714355 RepID=A0A1V2A556_9BACI|nr:LCP family protein [Domibacillus epiphyticus]OMP66125.1 LytR family transcriptional regulator [Domibacillus epiphyticus]